MMGGTDRSAVKAASYLFLERTLLYKCLAKHRSNLYFVYLGVTTPTLCCEFLHATEKVPQNRWRG